MQNINRTELNSIGLGYGELVLKGNNRKMFEDNVKNKLLNKLKGTNSHLYKDQNKMYISFEKGNFDKIYGSIKNIFGINIINPSIRVDLDIENIKNNILLIANELYEKGARTFKVAVNRANKKFPIESMTFAKELGAHILINSPFTKVSMKEPDALIQVEIRDSAYIFTEKIRMYGGMPLGSSGVGITLISGGIDSPVASFMMAKRGLKQHYATFHSFPFTSQKALEKVKDLVKILTEYNGRAKLFSFNILPLQNAIKEYCKEGYTTILTRRAMMRLSEMAARQYNYKALVTGESLGQVASQTIMGLDCTNAAVNLPVFRPLIGMDKIEIIDIATEIDTYETSILPYQDSCEMFAPKRPITMPEKSKIEEEEAKIEGYADILEEIYNNKEIVTIE